MGLDMYFEREIYIGANYEHRKVAGNIEVSIRGEKLDIDFRKVKRVVEEAGYWRKANAIHRWFVDHVQDGTDDCRRYLVSPEDMQALLDAVNAVLDDHSKAETLLPTQAGFLFGPTEYDEYYFADLMATKTIMVEALKHESDDYYYQSSW